MKYTGQQKRIICVLFQAVQLNGEVKAQLFNITRHLLDQQRTAINQVGSMAKELYKKETSSYLYNLADLMQDFLYSEGTMQEQQLEEAVMELSLSLITQQINSQAATSQNLLIYFASILSFNLQSSNSCSFTNAQGSTSILSRLVWVYCLFVLKYALPQYLYIYQKWPYCKEYNNSMA